MSATLIDPGELSATTTGPRLLLVEDNPGDAVLVREMLRETWPEGMEFTHVGELGAACAHLLEHGATCVLLDLSLPDAEGLEAVTHVSTAAPDVPIVVLSGYDDETLALRAVQGGAQDYLIKGRVDASLVGRAVRYAIERKRAEVELAHQALHDPLTGLPNRALFLDRLGLALQRSVRRPYSVAVLFLDLDRFKVINDSLGHGPGDHLLQDVAQRLEEVLRPSDTVARFGGDEFTILCEELGSERDAVRIAERVADALTAPFLIDDREAFVSVSIGIAIAGELRPAPEALIRDADAAMYRAKELGRSRYELFDEEMRRRAMERLELETALRRALERDELQVYYQPKVAVADETVRGFEALLRWEHPVRGLVAPAEFIELAEETGLIVSIGRWVLQQAARQVQVWRGERPDLDLAICVNLSVRQLEQPDLVDDVARVLADTGLEPHALVLEITESAVTQNLEFVSAVLERLKSLGVRLAIDDFGTGYSSLTYLKQYPADILKIDRNFVSGLGADPQDAPIVGAVVGLARALALDTIAEGVETEAQLAELRALGCNMAQGFLFAKPRPAAEARALLD